MPDHEESGTLISKSKRYKGRAFRVYRYKYQFRGNKIVRDIIVRRDGVVIIAVDDQDRVLLIREYCAGSNSMILSLPGGSIDVGEEPAAAAQRELREETGMAARRIEELYVTYSHPSTSSRKSFAFMARELYNSPLPASDEIIELLWLPFNEAIQAIRRPFASDASTPGLLLLASQIIASK